MTEKKDSQTTILKKLFRYIKKYMFLIILSLLFAAVSSVLALYVPILTGRAIDGIIGKNNVDFAGIFAVIRRMILVVAITAAEIGRAHV